MVVLIVVDPHQSCSLKVAVVSMPIPANSTALTETYEIQTIRQISDYKISSTLNKIWNFPLNSNHRCEHINGKLLLISYREISRMCFGYPAKV